MYSNATRVSIGLALILASTVSAANLIVNGTFESGSTSGWTPVSNGFSDISGSCNDSFAAQTTATGCQAGINPVSGSYAAYSSTAFPPISNNTGEWINNLNQNFLVPTSPIGSAILSWSDSAVWTHGSGTLVIAQLYQGSTFIANQYSVLSPGGNGQEAWTNHTWDMTSLLSGYQGQVLTLELSSVLFYDTRGGGTGAATSLTTGFDNVALTVNAPTPEPATIGLTGIALVGLGLVRRRSINLS